MAASEKVYNCDENIVGTGSGSDFSMSVQKWVSERCVRVSTTGERAAYRRIVSISSFW